MITTETVVSKIEILENGAMQVRESTYFVEDGKRISEPKYHRMAFIPGMEIKHFDKRIADIASVIWTPEVVAAFKAQQEADLKKLNFVPRE